MSRAAQPKEYVYLVVPGRITDRSQGRPVVGAVIRLEDSGTRFQPKEYVYLVVPGRITDRSQGRPVVGAVIRLEAGSRVFEAATDDGGVFVFERLPVASYEMRVTSGSGEVLRSIQEVDTDVPDLKRLRIRFGRGKERAAVIEAREEGVTVTAPEPPVRWKRFWTQFAVFAGSAALLAL